MTTDRRDFLKLFGTGCAIIPIIGGIPALAAEAKILEPPKIELAASPQLFGHVAKFGNNLPGGSYGITVFLEKFSGESTILTARTFLLSVEHNVNVIRSRMSNIPMDVVDGPRRVQWKMSGECFADESGDILKFYEDV